MGRLVLPASLKVEAVRANSSNQCATSYLWLDSWMDVLKPRRDVQRNSKNMMTPTITLNSVKKGWYTLKSSNPKMA